MSWVSDKPSPVTWLADLVVKKGLKFVSGIFCEMPLPLYFAEIKISSFIFFVFIETDGSNPTECWHLFLVIQKGGLLNKLQKESGDVNFWKLLRNYSFDAE